MGSADVFVFRDGKEKARLINRTYFKLLAFGLGFRVYGLGLFHEVEPLRGFRVSRAGV